MVIDDERHLRELLELGLAEDGFEVRTAADGQTGLALVRDWHPDAIILDVMMPYMNGLELLPMMRRVTEAPILMLSAKSDTDDRVTGLRRGADVKHIIQLYAEITAPFGFRAKPPLFVTAGVLHFYFWHMRICHHDVMRAVFFASAPYIPGRL